MTVAVTVAVVEVDGEALMARRPCESRALSFSLSLSFYFLSLFLFLSDFCSDFSFFNFFLIVPFINYLNFLVSLEK